VKRRHRCGSGRALLSAHRGAAGQHGLRDNSWEALTAAVVLPVEFVEFDVHRTADGRYVLHHLDHVKVGRRKLHLRHLSAQLIGELVGHPLVAYEDALELLAAHGKKAHIDLKLASPDTLYGAPGAAYELEAARTALRIMGSPESFILTSLIDRSVQVLAKWAAVESPGTLVGLSLGLGHWTANWWEQVLIRRSELFPARRLRRCGATLVVVEQRLAAVRVLRWAGRHRIPVLVWTVDRPRRLRRFLHDNRVWMVTSNHPSRARAARDYDTVA
jgi:glycerophosphoryl diester phosphodiesterase